METEWNMVVHDCKSQHSGSKARGSQIQGQPKLHNKILSQKINNKIKHMEINTMTRKELF
jgi:hypothetical protein